MTGPRFWTTSKPQAQRVVRCAWSCACQWCDMLTECSHVWPGDDLEEKKHWPQCSMFQCWWTSRSSELARSERVMWPSEPGFDQHDRLPDLHEDLPMRPTVSQSASLWCGLGWAWVDGGVYGCDTRPVCGGGGSVLALSVDGQSRQEVQWDERTPAWWSVAGAAL